MRRAAAASLAAFGLLAAVALAAGCASDDEPSGGESGALRAPSTAPEQSQPERGTEHERAQGDRPAPRPQLVRARCPADAAPGCRSASGRVLYVERVDPDGDGDAHFVLASRESITAPGLSVIDVRRDLRPRPLPRPGVRISAAGPVYRGSYGQRQIEAVVVHVAR